MRTHQANAYKAFLNSSRGRVIIFGVCPIINKHAEACNTLNIINYISR